MGKHSPGPWHVEAEVMAGGPILTVRGDEDGRIWICEVYGIEIDAIKDPTSEANARLIAAAPDLLDALSELLADYRAATPIGWRANTLIDSRASKAIAKAEGRTA